MPPLSCAEHRRAFGASRRNFLRIGSASAFGLTLSSVLRREASAAPANRGAKAKSVILLWLQGGVTHHETFDPKPLAPADVRGIYNPIATSLPGYHVSEMIPRLARSMEKLAVVRSATHRESAHERGSMYMVEGRRPGRGASGSQPSGNPQLGAIVAHELGAHDGMPAFVSNPGRDFTSNFVGAGWLPPSANAFAGYNARSLRTNDGIDADRFGDRLSLRAGLTRANGPSSEWDEFDEKAIDIISSGKGAAAFDWQSESDETKELYGLGSRGGGLGELALTARRLVEAGTRFVTCGQNSWDYHSDIFPQCKGRLPRFDAGFAGLVTDLEQRGLLDETLVVYLTEYGRTPKINSQAGRDHWPSAFSVAFAGAGIRTGQVIGASDAQGGAVTERPVSPEEIAATILHLVGIDPRTDFVKPDGRPIQYVDHADPIRELLA